MVSVGVAQKIASRAAAAGLTWEAVEALDDVTLEERLYGRPVGPADDRPRPAPVHIHRELRRVGVTLELLHLEYLEQHPTGLRYTAFCDVYWLPKAGVVMRQVHRAAYVAEPVRGGAGGSRRDRDGARRARGDGEPLDREGERGGAVAS